MFQWVEWINTTAMGANAVLSGNIQASYHIGDYGTDETFLNPVKVITDPSNNWKPNSYSYGVTDSDPSIRPPGSIGDAIIYTQYEGPLKASNTM